MALPLADRFAQATGHPLHGFDPASLGRGADLQAAGRVLWVSEPVPGHLEGDVRGSGRRVYRTSVALRLTDTTVSAEGNCSCPIGRQCKHAAALLAEWLARRPPDAPPADEAQQLERLQKHRQQAMLWVRKLQLPGTATAGDLRAGEAQAEAAKEADYRLYYVLVPERRHCRLRVFRLRSGPAGRLLGPSDDDEAEVAPRLDDYPLLREAGTPAAASWTATDRRVAGALAGAHWQSGRGLALDAPHARAVLFDLARDGRLYLYRPPRHQDDPPLTLAEARPGELAWDAIGQLAPAAPAASAGRNPGSPAGDAGSSGWGDEGDERAAAGAQLGLAVGGRGQPLYLAEPAWVDRFANAIGPLALDLTPALLDWLRAAPVVPQAVGVDIATALRAQLHARPGLAERIPPMPGATVTEIREAPRPVLGLFMSTAAPRRSPKVRAASELGWLVVSLAVQYQGQRMEPLRAYTVAIQTPAGPALVVTDPEAEAQLRTRLIERLEDLDDDETITFARERAAGRTGWLTIGSLPGDGLAAVRIRHDLTRQLAAEGWLVQDQTEWPNPVIDAAPDLPAHAAPDLPAQTAGQTAPPDAATASAPAEDAPVRARLQLKLQPDIDDGKDGRGDAWFTLTLGLRIGPHRIDLAPVLAAIVEAGSFDAWRKRQAPDGVYWLRHEPDWLRLPVELIEPIAREAAAWAELPPAARREPAAAGSADGAASAPPPTLRIDGRAAARLALGHGIALPDRLRKLVDWMANHDGITPVTPSPQFATVLRPYQQAGVGWLRFIADGEAGGILADDMGLGKTVQILAHLDAEKARGRLSRPALVVAPTSVVRNWAAEAARHAPALRTLLLIGPDRARRAADIDQHDLVLTTYALLPRDAETLTTHAWQAVVLDEAQWVKNSRTRAATVLRRLQATHRIALTGTPLENHLGELWSIIDLTMPGLLGNETAFRRRFRLPIERGRDSDDPQLLASGSERMQALAGRLRPFMLRRTKDEVLADLPERTEVVLRVEMGSEQRERYELLRTLMDQRVREALARADTSGGRAIGQGRLVLLDALLKLRQVCCDPALVRLPRGDGRSEGSGDVRSEARPAARAATGIASAKRDALIELLATLVAENRKALVFSQFTRMLDLIETAIDSDPRLAAVTRSRLDGETADRTAAIDDFQQGDARIFLLSLKAGGVGLNLTAADTVILYDPWWNPAVERQAADRAHRIGQTQPVFVYKLVVSDSIEERMLAMQAEKAELAEAVLSGSLTGAGASLSRDDLMALLEDDATTAPLR